METGALEITAAFIREHRGNEGNFEKLYSKLETEIEERHGLEKYVASLEDIREKAVPEYKKAKESGGTAWPEFEKFVTEFERAVVSAK